MSRAIGEIKKICVESYRAYVKAALVPNGLKHFLRTHERLPTFIDNLAFDLSNVPHLTREQIEDATRSLSATFIASAQRLAEERTMSPLQKAMLKAKADRAREVQEHLQRLEDRSQSNVTQDKAGHETTKEKIVLQTEDIERLGLS